MAGNKSWRIAFACFLPLFILIALPLFGIRSVWISWLAFLACPIAMISMMRMNKDEKCH